MLDQYISNRLQENEEKLAHLNEQLLRLQSEEDTCNSRIQKLVEQEDVGFEFFSPRYQNESSRHQISDIKNEIESIHLQQAKIEDSMAELKIENTNYQEMLEEIRSHELRDEKEELLEAQSKEDRAQFNKELKNIMQRVDKCINLLSGTNKGSCKNELVNLKYYLKALISGQ